MSFSVLAKHSLIDVAVLFGSAARNTEDSFSDIDLLVICKNRKYHSICTVKQWIRDALANNINVCIYTWHDIFAMAKKGSLFLWHVKLEGKIIFSKSNHIEKVLNTLHPYDNYQNDFDLYKALLSDVKSSWKQWGALCEFDFAMLFTIMRNASMLLCYRLGEPKFGRRDAYLLLLEQYGNELGVSYDLYEKLCFAKLWYERRVGKPNEFIESDRTPHLIDNISGFLRFVRSRCLCGN